MKHYNFYKKKHKNEYIFQPGAFQGGWVVGGVSAKDLFEEIADTLHIPFYDECCENEQQIPVRYNRIDNTLEAYNPITKLFETIIIGGGPSTSSRETLKFTTDGTDPYDFMIPSNCLMERMIIDPTSDSFSGLFKGSEIIVYEENVTEINGAVWGIDKYIKAPTLFSITGLPINSVIYVTITHLN